MSDVTAKKIPAPLALFLALRPKQWVKNGVLLAGLVFTLDQHHGAADWLKVAAAVAVFCALASSIYLVNDICDIEQDRQHPRKRHRPLAAGLVSIPTAQITSAMLALIGLLGAVALGRDFAIVCIIYVVLTFAYSLYLKHIVLIDVMTLASFYVIRAAAGAVVISVEISPWLLVCTTLGALLLGLAKRRNELTTLTDAGNHRKILQEYTVEMLDQLIVIFTGCTLVAYMLYTFSSHATEQRRPMMLTIPFVIYGVLRFFYLTHKHGKGGDPSSELLEDRGLLMCGILWAITCAAVILLTR